MRIRAVVVYRVDATEDELAALRELMAAVPRDQRSALSDVQRAWYEALNVAAIDTPEDDTFDETLPEKALRVSAGRRKGRLTPVD